MFCKNCGKDVVDGSEKCEFCGQDFSKPVEKSTPVGNLLKKSKQNKLLFGGVLCGIILVVAGLIIFLNLPNTPTIEQLKSDFVDEVLRDEGFEITTFDIISDSDEKNEQYNATVNIVYDNTKTEHRRKYEFVYKKYDEWVLLEIEPYEEENWNKLPVSSPTISEYKELCKNSLSDIGYAVFEPIEEKTIVDLDNAETTVYFNVESQNTLGKISGNIIFLLKYNFEEEKWKIDNVSPSEDYSIQTNFLNIWSGSAQPLVKKDFWGNQYATESFVFEIIKHEGTQAEGILTFNNEKHKLTGTIEPSSKFGISSSINLDDNGDFGISGHIKNNGEMSVRIDTKNKADKISWEGDGARRYLYDVILKLQ